MTDWRATYKNEDTSVERYRHVQLGVSKRTTLFGKSICWSECELDNREVNDLWHLDESPGLRLTITYPTTVMIDALFGPLMHTLNILMLQTRTQRPVASSRLISSIELRFYFRLPSLAHHGSFTVLCLLFEAFKSLLSLFCKPFEKLRDFSSKMVLPVISLS